MFLDGGEFNLGMLKDSTLSKITDYRMFAETFEKAVFRGHESLALTFNLEPTGESACCINTSALRTYGWVVLPVK